MRIAGFAFVGMAATEEPFAFAPETRSMASSHSGSYGRASLMIVT